MGILYSFLSINGLIPKNQVASEVQMLPDSDSEQH